MELISPRNRRYGDEQPAHGTFMSALPMARNIGMTLLAVLLAVVFANMVCG